MNNNEDKETKKTIKSDKNKLRYILTLIIVALFASGVTVFIYESSPNQTFVGIDGVEQDELDELVYLQELIQTGYIEDVDTRELYDGALKGMVEAIGDPYSSYMTAKEAKEFEQDISGNFEGIGAVMTMTNDVPTVAEAPIKDSPAEKGKLQVGDEFIKVDGVETKGKTLNEIVGTVRGEKGTDVVLTVQRGAEVFDVTLTRDVIPIESVYGSIDEKYPDVGLIEITAFNTTTSDEFDQQVEELRKQGATSFIIDVRGNPGGVLGEVEKITSRFLKDDQTIVKFDSKLDGTREDRASSKLDDGEKITEPTVLLIDGNSASASEIMAGAFIESANIDVIGTTTFGKGTVQTIIPTGTGGELKLTIQKWLTPDGTWIHEKGIDPTIEVETPEYINHKLIDSKKTYELGSAGEHVQTINDYLSVLGYTDAKVVDIYTEDTQQAIKKFQKEHKLKETGTTDTETTIELEKAILEYWKNNDNQYNKGLEILGKTSEN